mgnify:FL=1
MLDLVVPLYNEAAILKSTVETLEQELGSTGLSYRIILVDNNSSDETLSVAQDLADRSNTVQALHVPVQGKSRAIRAGWEDSDADVLGFVDADLSPGLDVIPQMVRVVEEDRGLAVSSRLLPTSVTTRSFSRSLVSQSYNMMVRLLTRSPVSDHQCGLKVVHRDAWETIQPVTRSTEWFLDTEIMLHALRLGIPIDEFAIRWHDADGSGVNTVSVTWKITLSLYRYWRQHGFPGETDVLTVHPIPRSRNTD